MTKQTRRNLYAEELATVIVGEDYKTLSQIYSEASEKYPHLLVTKQIIRDVLNRMSKSPRFKPERQGVPRTYSYRITSPKPASKNSKTGQSDKLNRKFDEIDKAASARLNRFDAYMNKAATASGRAFA